MKQHHPAPFHLKTYKGLPGCGHGIAIFPAGSSGSIAQVHARPATYPFATDQDVNDTECEATARLFKESPRMLLLINEISERNDIPRDMKNAAATLINAVGCPPNITRLPDTTATPRLEELAILLGAGAYWADAEEDADLRDPMSEVCDIAREANEMIGNLPPCYKEAPAMLAMLKRVLAKLQDPDFDDYFDDFEADLAATILNAEPV